MKKTNVFIMLLVSLLCCYSCDSDIEITSNQMDPNLIHTPDPYYVDFQTALDEALDMFAFQDKQTRTSMKNARTVSSHKEFVANRYTRSLGDTIPVRFHVINFSDNNGYALVSADSRTTPVYAYSLSGNLDVEDAVANTGFGVFINNAIKYYQDEVDSGTPPPLPPFQPSPTDTTQYGDVPLLMLEEYDGNYYHVRNGTRMIAESGYCEINTAWDQNWPYNMYCGDNSNSPYDCGYKNAAGCGPVAAAQIMSHFCFPNSYNGTNFDWSQIMSSTSYNQYYPDYNSASQATALLIRKIGEAANATYGTLTSTTINNMGIVFQLFGYTGSGVENFSASKVKSSLNSGWAVYIRGTNEGGIGHAWAIDGYQKWKYQKTYYYTYPPYAKFDSFMYYEPTTYYRCRWGWGGRNDGMCLDVFEGYKNNNRIIYNIRPNL